MPTTKVSDGHSNREEKEKLLSTVLYVFSFLAIIAISICWITLDISLTFIYPFNDPEQSGLQTLSWGSLNIVLGFIMKSIICLKLCPNSLSTAEKWQIISFGSLVRVGCAWAIRYPLYAQYRYYPGMDFQSQLVQWLLSDPVTFFVASILAIATRNAVEYVTLPYFISMRFRKVNPLRIKLEEKEKKLPQKTAMGYVNTVWIVLWCFGVMVGASVGYDYYSQSISFMYAILWVPLLAVFYILLTDKATAASKKYHPLNHNLSYIILYLWMIELVPELCSNILYFSNSPYAFTNNSIFWTFVYQSFMIFMRGVFESILEFAGHGKPIHDQILFPVQFFKTFFENLFFIELSLSDPVFWIILLMQLLYNFYEGTIGIELEAIKRMFRGKFRKSTINLKKDSEEELRNLFEERFEIRNRIIGVFQDFMSELTAAAALLATYYAYISFLSVNEGEKAAASYSQYFGINNFQTDFYTLALQFVVISLLRLFFHAAAVLVLHRQVRTFNNSIPQPRTQDTLHRSVLKSNEMLALKNTDNNLNIKSVGRIPRLSIARLVYQHLNDDWWLFFVVVCLSVTRLCFSARSGLYSLKLNPDTSYWSEMIFRRLLVG